jgi:Fur family peroxide stress response transcriptional regulator
MKTTHHSRQREILYEALCATQAHPTAETLFLTLRTRYPNLSLATVYRNLHILVEEGRALQMPFATDRFDARTESHPHFYCLRCDTLFDLPVVPPPDTRRCVEKLGYAVRQEDLIFKGHCPVCAAQEEREAASAKTK